MLKADLRKYKVRYHNILKKLSFYSMRTTIILLLTCTLSAQTKKFIFYYNSGKKIPRNYNQFKDSVIKWGAVAENISVISVNGFADDKGSVQSNLRLSKKRADKADELLKTLNLRYKTYKTKGFGEEQPAATNATIEGRSKNRRVEVELFLTLKIKTEEPVVVIPPETKPKKDCDERDTMIVLPGGTEIEITGCSLDGVKLNEIKIDAEEFFDKDKMIQNDMFTQTANGQCLSTGGMLKLRITDKNGNPVKLKPKKDLTIRIPKISADTAFDLYQMKTDKDKENVGWEKRNEQIKYKPGTQKFEFKMSDPVISLNLDFLPKPLGGLVKRKTFIKTRVVRNAKVYMNGGESVLRMKKLRPRKFDVKGCDCIPINQQFVTAFAKKDGKIYYCHKKLSELKRRIIINQKFIIRKRDYVVLDDKNALNLQMKGDFAQQ